MIRQRWYQFGKVFGMRYLFELRGDGLAMHTHAPGEDHNIIVLRGSVRVSGGGFETYAFLDSGSIIERLPLRHEIVALEPDTWILNLYANGMPPGYENLPETEHDIRCETRPLTYPL